MSKITPYESNLDEIVTDGFELSGVLTRQDEINELRTELAIERGCRIAAGGERDELRAKLAALEDQRGPFQAYAIGHADGVRNAAGAATRQDISNLATNATPRPKGTV